jgi:hypothetical protein
MSSRTLRRTLTLTLVLSAGALSLRPAEAAPLRNGSRPAGPAVQVELFSRNVIEVVKDFLGLLKDSPPGPPNGGGSDPHGGMGREGTGICPHGKPPYPGGI